MRIEITIDEARELARATGKLPNCLTSLTAEGDDIRFVVDLRLLPAAPGPVKLASRLVPQVRGTLSVVDFDAGTLVLAVQASAGALPAEKLLGFAEGPIATALRKRGLPAEAVQVLSGGRVAVDAQVLLGRLVSSLPGAQITGLDLTQGTLTVTAAL